VAAGVASEPRIKTGAGQAVRVILQIQGKNEDELEEEKRK
jgi:hypothetical protein